jgi:hypothetical protein
MATDENVLRHIQELTGEEHHLYEKGGLTDAERDRLREIGVALDRYWDLLRQRRAKREFGQDPDEAAMRPARTVEGYEG